MKTIFGVKWIEVEYGWGDRPEGWKLYATLQEAIDGAKADSANGNFEGGYCGPTRPVTVVEIDAAEIQPITAGGLASGPTFTANHWNPQNPGKSRPVGD